MVLQRHAAPFTDTPNSVLRRILSLDPREVDDQQPGGSNSRDGRQSIPGGNFPQAEGKGRSRARSRTRPRRGMTREGKGTPRAPSGSLLPEDEYIFPILESVAERGGTAPVREIIHAVGERLKGKLSPTDLEALSSGSVRWQNRAQFVRLRLVEEGLLSKDAPRGIWSLTPAGKQRLSELRQENGDANRRQTMSTR